MPKRTGVNRLKEQHRRREGKSLDSYSDRGALTLIQSMERIDHCFSQNLLRGVRTRIRRVGMHPDARHVKVELVAVRPKNNHLFRNERMGWG